jgi:hypothetical protein
MPPSDCRLIFHFLAFFHAAREALRAKCFYAMLFLLVFATRRAMPMLLPCCRHAFFAVVRCQPDAAMPFCHYDGVACRRHAASGERHCCLLMAFADASAR